MAYASTNPPTKKALRESIKAGDRIEVFQPGPFGPEVKDGPVTIEGPHYPKPHRWYARVIVNDGVIVKLVG